VAELSVLTIDRLPEHTAKHDRLGVVVTGIEVLNEEHADTALLLVVSSEGGEGNSDVVQVL